MKIIETDLITPDKLTPFEREQVYNGLDCCVTAELIDILLPQLDNQTAATYAFSRALQGPCLEMRLRGVLVDQVAKAEVIETYYAQLDFLERRLERIVREGLDFVGFNWRSNPDLHKLFYEYLGIPQIKKMGRPTVDRDALEKMEGYLVARPIIAHILLMRDIGKKISVLKTGIDPDGRIRSSYNIAGTNTFRFSSSFSEFGTGGNLQNVEDLLRRVFIADPGYKLGYFDGEQIQSRIVGALEWEHCNDGKYLDACESGDLHTYVAKLCEPKLAWTGDPKADKDLAETPGYYRHHDLRKLCKSIGHGTNFGGGPDTLHKMYKIERELIFQFQQKYFSAFPGHRLWHAWVQWQIEEFGTIHSICGPRRQFWGRRDSPDTIREAIAFDPQCSEAVIVNTGMLNVWRSGKVQLLMQCHDAIVVQYPEEKEDELVPQILALMRHPIELKNGRQLIIPYGAKTGWNWGSWAKDNQDGLKTYKGHDERKRAPQKSILDRVVRSIHKRSGKS
jgi:DNA polymerase-1